MKVSANKESVTLSPLMQKRGVRKSTTARLAGVISKARAREWIRHVKNSRGEWK